MTTLANYAASPVAFDVAPYGFVPVEHDGVVLFERQDNWGRLPMLLVTPTKEGWGPEFDWQEVHLLWASLVDMKGVRLKFENLAALVAYLDDVIERLPGFEVTDSHDAVIPF